MGIFSFGNTRKPRRFNYSPIYWDPEKEKIKEMEEKHRAEKNDDSTYHVGIKRGSFRKQSERADLGKKTKEQRKLMIKLMFALFVLLLLALYLILNGSAIFSLYFDNGL